MKKLLFAALALCCGILHAQKISTAESEENFNLGKRNAVTTTIYGEHLADVKRQWEKFFKTYKYETVTDNGNEMKGHNIFFKEILGRPVDIYSHFDLNKEEKTIKMSTALDMGASNYLHSSKNPNEVKALEKIIHEFALKMTKLPFEEFKDAAVNYQAKLKGEISELDKKHKNGEKDIVDFKNKITRLEQKLTEKNTALAGKKTEVEAQKKSLDTVTVKESSAAKATTKKYDKLREQQADLEQDIKDLEANIADNHQKIKSTENDMKVNRETRITNLKEIEKQKIIAEGWQKKINSVF